MTQAKLMHIDPAAPRAELHDLLGLTGAEVSLNSLPAGASVPFVHRHTGNEEIYIILEGAGRVYLDGEETDLKAGDVFAWIPPAPAALRPLWKSPSGLSAYR